MKPSHGTMLVLGGAVVALGALFVLVNYTPYGAMFVTPKKTGA